MRSGAALGEFRTTQFTDDDGKVRVDINRADPRVVISAPIVDAARSGASPWMSMDGDVLHIRASNRTVAYRLGEYEHGRFGYVGERVG
jgi:hypothetical protein